MKILVICQYYRPEPFRVSDLCEELVRRGHSVTVITGTPNYPMGVTYPGYEHGKRQDEVVEGVKVHRCHTIGRKGGALRRLLNYHSFAAASTRYVRHLKEEFDRVFVYQLSPVMMARAGVYLKRRRGFPLTVYCLDLWPESLVVGGILRGSLLYRFFNRVSEKIYRSADRILVSSFSFRNYFAKQFGLTERIGYLPQYAESIFDPAACHKEPDGKIDLLFAGNIGVAQDVPTILRAADVLRNTPDLYWHIVGDGSELAACRALSAEMGLTNVFFHGRLPVEEMPSFYRMADAMLVTMKPDPVICLTLPGKVQTYLAAGKPILCAADGETDRVISEAGCGFAAAAGDAAGLAECVLRFCRLSDSAALGRRAAAYYADHYARERVISDLESFLAEETPRGNAGHSSKRKD